ncbi:aminotransferase, class II [Melissococcus plutonius ATCC 35311]|uniref:cysteine-S-conjugate beta-lyase n=1 Tax=Melissococcus plutonius (strain ATCC 35311 / DSM 29964 / CIP 104052 / LMG 20360 / NCIMB 702443) TaxID=940190 RepID=F3Y949_MELPT|nr:cystathionine beta-lyase [Melissococcus plutonius]BAK21027.1 aminotransferase, class II [Melissococcus plutonius ATCC 35311]
MIHDPVYPPFAQVVLDNQRKLIQSPLLIKDNQFKMDLTLMEKQMREHLIQLFILCNPHNPGGRVWSKEELQDFGELCEKYHIIVVSDEIHQDLVFSPYQFTTFTNAQSTFKEFSITLTAATKTFNLAGIKNSMVFIQNPKLKKIFQIQQEKNKQEEINTFGYIGTEAAYKYGDEWLTELLAYLKENIKLVETFFANKFPQVKVMVPEGTYLVWLDFSSLNLTDEQLQECLIQKGKVVLNPGISFGPTGTQHMRLNTACSKEVLIEGLERIKHAFQ